MLGAEALIGVGSDEALRLRLEKPPGTGLSCGRRGGGNEAAQDMKGWGWGRRGQVRQPHLAGKQG